MFVEGCAADRAGSLSVGEGGVTEE